MQYNLKFKALQIIVSIYVNWCAEYHISLGIGIELARQKENR